MIFSKPLIIALLVLVVALGVCGWFLKLQMEKTGELEARLEQASQDNQLWREMLEKITAQGQKLDKLDARVIGTDKYSRQRLSELDRKLEGAIDEIEDVKEWADARMPEPVVDLMCESGNFSSAATAELCTKPVSN